MYCLISFQSHLGLCHVVPVAFAGNYVVQYILENCPPKKTKELLKAPVGHLPKLAMQKFSSNVIETCLEKSDESTRATLIEELVSATCPSLHIVVAQL
jgi:hypothetical protein